MRHPAPLERLSLTSINDFLFIRVELVATRPTVAAWCSLSLNVQANCERLSFLVAESLLLAPAYTCCAHLCLVTTAMSGATAAFYRAMQARFALAFRHSFCWSLQRDSRAVAALQREPVVMVSIMIGCTGAC
jgi:hypothetical protein